MVLDGRAFEVEGREESKPSDIEDVQKMGEDHFPTNLALLHRMYHPRLASLLENLGPLPSLGMYVRLVN